MERPVASDLAGWDLELWKDEIDGSGTLVRSMTVPGVPDGEASGTQVTTVTVHLLDQNPGDEIWARARAIGPATRATGRRAPVGRC